MRNPLKAYPGPIEFMLAADSPTIEGTVLDASSTRLAEDCVIFMTKDFPLINRPTNFHGIRFDQNGTFRFSGFPGGQYRVIALTGLTDNACVDPASMTKFLSLSDSLGLSLIEKQTLRLKLISASMN